MPAAPPSSYPSSSSRALRGPFFMPQGGARGRRPGSFEAYLRAGWIAHIETRGRAAPFSWRSRSLEGLLGGKASALPGAEGPYSRIRALGAACRSGRSARLRKRRPGVRPVEGPFRSAPAIQMHGAGPAPCIPFLSKRRNRRTIPRTPASLRRMGPRAHSPPSIRMIIDMVLHLRAPCLPRRAPRARGGPGDSYMCTKCADRYSRPRGARSLASLIPARRQPQGGPARVP